MIVKNKNTTLSLLPAYGIGAFIVLYGVAAFLYPGGSGADKTTRGFSWLHNYWCELMASFAQNGAINTARPVAITGLVVLAGSLSVFWYHAPLLFNNSRWSYWVIRYPGIFSMLSLVLFFITPHDWAMNIAGTPGVIALCGVLAGLYRKKWKALLTLGVLCLFLCVVNNYVYYSGMSMYYLPIIQKITFFFFLLWFSLVAIRVHQTPINAVAANGQVIM